MTMDLIERYVQEVARRLPRKQRDDIARELRSSLEDSLESRTDVPLDQLDEELPTELLLEFGPPEEVAASYRSGPDHLIGPAHYSGFIKTMKIGLAVIGGLIAFGILVDVAGSSRDLGELGRIGAQGISDLQTGFLTLLGLVVLVFAIIERTSPPRKAAQTDWDPQNLPPVAEDPDRIDRTGTIVGLVLGAIALAVLNLSPEWLKIHVFSNGDQFSVPFLGPVLRSEVFIFSLYLVLGLILGVIVLVQGRWRLPTRLLDAATSAILVFFLARLWGKSDQLLPDEADLREAGWPTEQLASFAEVVDDVLSPLLWWLLLAGFLAALWFALRKIVAIVRMAAARRFESVS
jgi:hypothetical protein